MRSFTDTTLHSATSARTVHLSPVPGHPLPIRRQCAARRADVTSVVLLVVLALVSGSSFLYYGGKVLVDHGSREEFERYGVPAVRRLVGVLEVLGGTGVILGLAVAPLGALAAAGLATLMILGVIVRIRIHDAPRLMVPAATLAVLNAVLVVLFLAQ
jgi:uncharacterized membrane protein YphA (DoxX/SURF4 family)